MPTLVGHALVGAAIGSTAPRGVRLAPLIAAAATISMLPDADVLGFRLGIPYAHPLGHRGLTHGLPFAALVGALAAGWLRARGRPHALRLGALLALACASHGLLDAATDGGLGIGFWIPFSPERSFLPWRPLPVSPLELDTFFGARGASILTREALWLGLPGLALVAGAAWTRRRA